MDNAVGALVFVLPVIPRTKKNSQQMVQSKKTGRWFPVPSKQYKQFEKECGKYLKEIIPTNPIAVPVNIRCYFYMPTERPVDLTNLLEAVDDVLVKYGILEDDNNKIVAGHDGSRVYVDKGNPRIVVSVEELDA